MKIIREPTIIYPGNKIGTGLQTGHFVLVRENNVIGNNVRIGSYSHVAFDCVIEDDVTLHTGVYVFEHSILRRGCWIGPGVILTNSKYPKGKDSKSHIEGCEIGEYAKIGAGSVILPGVNVGARALVGAGSVVTKDVLPGVVVSGNPAKAHKLVGELEYADGSAVYDR